MKILWDHQNSPINISFDRLIYTMRQDDQDGLLLDSASVADIVDASDGVVIFDAMITLYRRLEAKMIALSRMMDRVSATVKPIKFQISDPFMQTGTAQVAVVFELSDGQTLSIFFHNPDTTPKKILPDDDLISWKWLLNKRDVTIVVAPEKGHDLNVRDVATRVIKLAEKNSAVFARQNKNRAEKMQALQALKDEVAGKEKTLAEEQKGLEVAQNELQLLRTCS